MNHWRLQCLSLFSWIKKHFGNTKHITHAQISLLVSMWLLTLWCLLHSSKSLSSPFFTPWVFWTPGVREFNSLQRRRPPNVQTPEPRACECVPGYCYCLVLSFEYLVVRVVSCLIAKRMKMWMLHSPFSFSPLPLLQLLTIHPWLLFKRAFIHPSIHPLHSVKCELAAVLLLYESLMAMAISLLAASLPQLRDCNEAWHMMQE